jgi:hypothetical protein
MHNIRLTNIEVCTYQGIYEILEDITLDGILVDYPCRISNDREHLLANTHDRLVKNGWMSLLEYCYADTDSRLISEQAGFSHVSTRRLLCGIHYVTSENSFM